MYVHTQSSPLRTALVLLSFGLAYPFSRLTTVVTEDTVTATFRMGWPKRAISRSQITNVEIVRNKWWHGLAIRLIPGSTTMYNVWGLDAVQIKVAGKRNFRIGTNDPEGLASALNSSEV